MKRKELHTTNYLEKIPCKSSYLKWSQSEDGKVTLEIENKGAMNRIAQKLFKKPKISYIHLDKTGSFVWPLIDGKKDIIELGKEVDAHFGEEAHPLYERLAQFFHVLESYKFINWIE